MTAAPHKRLTRTALRDSVYEMLLDMLLSGGLAPGESVSIERMARALDVSPTPVREALVHLERTGLVAREALRGYRVAPPLTPQQISDLCRARLVLEVGAMAEEFQDLDTLIQHLKSAHRAHEDAADALEAMYRSGEIDFAVARRYFDADWAFHRALIHHTGNQYLKAMSDQLFPHIHRLRQAVRHGESDAAQAVAEHRAILDAIQRGDADDARAAMRRHLENVLERSIADERNLASRES